ncbi:MAG: PEGA domain-containing protein [Candidatus Acidoferrales bacterium]
MQGKLWAGLLVALAVTVSVSATPKPADENPGPVLFSACPDVEVMTVHIYSEPERARVRVDGALVGQTPAKLCLPAGSHTIDLGKKGHQDWTRTLETLPGSEVLLRAELKKGRTEAEKDDYYRTSAAVAWSLEEIEDDKSCVEAKDKYQRKHGGLPLPVRDAIETTYLDLMGTCDSNDPPRAARNQARRYLID